MPELPQDLSLLADPRVPVAALGLLLIGWGARLYRVAIVAPGFVAGVFIGLQLASGAELTTRLIAGLTLGIIGGAILHFAERFAIAVTGALLIGGLANAIAPLVMGGPVPWYVPTAASLLGLLLFPSVYRALLKLITPLLGALCVAWALDRPQDVLLIGGLAAAGVIFQLVLGGTRKDKE